MREELFFSWQHTLKESNGTSMCLFVKSWVYIQSWNCYVEHFSVARYTYLIPPNLIIL